MKIKKIAPVAIIVLILIGLAIRQFVAGRNFLYAGTVEATEVDLSPRLSSTIQEVMVREGDAVKKGQVVVRLSGEDVRIAAEQAKSDMERARRLLRSGSITEEAFDRARFKWDDAALKQSWLDIGSPIDGTVLDKFYEPGEMVGPQNKLLRLADLNDVWARIYVPQPLLARLSLGMDVEAFLPESDMKKLTGRIVQIRDEAEFTPKNVQTRDERARLVYAVKVQLPNADRVLKPGMTVEVRLPEK